MDSIGSPKGRNLTDCPSVILDGAGEERSPPYGRGSAYSRAAQCTMMQQVKRDQEADGILVDGMNEMKG